MGSRQSLLGRTSEFNYCCRPTRENAFLTGHTAWQELMHSNCLQRYLLKWSRGDGQKGCIRDQMANCESRARSFLLKPHGCDACASSNCAGGLILFFRDDNAKCRLTVGIESGCRTPRFVLCSPPPKSFNSVAQIASWLDLFVNDPI